MKLTEEELRGVCMAALTAAGADESTARSVVSPLLTAELDGLTAHGVSRIPFFVDQVKEEKIRVDAKPKIVQKAPSIVMVDADRGFAFPSIDMALDALVPLSRKQGLAMAGVSHSHHCGALGVFSERLAREGLVSIIMSNSPASMAPWGGNRPTFGTNPIAFGCPGYPDPIIIDMSLSRVNRAELVMAHQQGTKIPAGWALDRDGQPTMDPMEALEGTILPAGGVKGAALAMMVEILTGCLNGANCGYEAAPFMADDHLPPDLGQTFMAIDPEKCSGSFLAKVGSLAGVISSQDGARIPGERRFQQRRRNLREGIFIPDDLFRELVDLARQGRQI